MREAQPARYATSLAGHLCPIYTNSADNACVCASVSFCCAPILSSMDVRASNDPVGLARFWNLAQDASELFALLLQAHFKAKPTPF